MSRGLESSDLVVLPRTDANSAHALATLLLAATRDEAGKPRKLPENVKAARDDMEEDATALQEVLGAAPAAPPEVRAADAMEDLVVGAISDIVKGWARLAGHLPEGDEAARTDARLFKGGLGFLNLKAPKEWSVVDTKIKTIESEGFDKVMGTLGMAPVLKLLKTTHAHYGEVTGATKARPALDSPEVRAKYDTLMGSIRHYVAAVVGSVVRRKPETKELADALLTPLAEWESPKIKAKAPAEPSKGAPPAKEGDKPT